MSAPSEPCQYCHEIDARMREAELSLAQAQAREAKMREACELGNRRLGYWCDLHGSLDEDRAALTAMQSALATPADDGALREMLEQAAKDGWAACLNDESAMMWGTPEQRTTEEHAAKRIVARVLGDQS